MLIGKENYNQLLKYSALFFVASLTASFSIIELLIVPNITIAYKRALYLIAKNEPVSITGCLKYSFDDGTWWRSTCFLVLMSLLFFTGLLLFIIPGIVLAVTLFFAPVSFASEKKGAFEAFNHSSLLVKKVGFFKILGFAAFVIFAATFGFSRHTDSYRIQPDCSAYANISLH